MTQTEELALTGETRREIVGPGATMQLISDAVLKGNVPVETMQKLMDMRDRELERNARMEFFRELAEFQAAHRVIATNQDKEIVSEKGARFRIKYADLPHLVDEVQQPLAKRGFSFTWDTTANESGSMLTSTFVLRHVLGHVERNSFTCPTESRAGSSPQMKYGSADSYAKRRAMLAGLGIVTEEDTGQHVRERDVQAITEEQAATIRALIEETKAQESKILGWAGVATLEQMPATKYAECVRILEGRRK